MWLSTKQKRKCLKKKETYTEQAGCKQLNFQNYVVAFFLYCARQVYSSVEAPCGSVFSNARQEITMFGEIRSQQ